MTLNLLALPCAGASATMYLRWRKYLPEYVRLIPVELPGRGMRLNEPFVEDFKALIDLLCREHQQHMRERYMLFGHSMGAILAYGMACALRDHTQRLPERLFVSASPAPCSYDSDHFADKKTDQALIADLRKQGGTPEGVFTSAELLRMTLDTLAADYRICETFTLLSRGSPLPVPLHVLAGRSDDIDSERLQSWRKETAHSFTLDWFDGNHFFIWQQEAVVLDRINQLMCKACI